MRHTVLVVDNHRIMLQFMANLLERQGCRVLTAENGLAALDILDVEKPDVMFVDLVMPNITGQKLCRIIRKIPQFNDVFIVVLSAIAAEETRHFSEFGADACIAKGPFDVMSGHVLRVLKRLEMPAPKIVDNEVVGLDSVHPREITKELLAVNRHFEEILDRMCEGILEINEEGRIIYASSVAVALIGLPEEKLLGARFLDLVRERDRGNVLEVFINPGESVRTLGEDEPVEVAGKPVIIKTLPMGFQEGRSVAILHDMSERRRIEERLRRAQKMEAVGTLAAGIAHGFNNLLTGIQGNASLMLLSVGSDDPNYVRLKNIENQVQRAAGMVNQLLGYARKGRYEVRPLDLNAVVSEVITTFAEDHPGIEVESKLSPDLLLVEADKDQLKQVLVNLCSNAYQAMPQGGRISAETRNVAQQDIDCVAEDVCGREFVLLTFSDTGAGMDDETRERVFDPFFTTRKIGWEAGIGLASIYGIIAAHKGFVEVDSEPGSGTSFRVYLPSCRAARKESSRREKPAEGTGRMRTVLLVDDDEVVLDVAGDMLKALGYRVLCARDGLEAVNVYSRDPREVDLVMMDMVMPNMGGGEAFDRIRRIDPTAKVLLCSGYSSEGEATDILARGCNGFIQKPFDLEKLSGTINQILE